MVRRLLVWVISGLVTAWITLGCLALPGTAFAATDSGDDSAGAPGSSQPADPPKSTAKTELSTAEPSGPTAGPKADTDAQTGDTDTPDVDATDVDTTDKDGADSTTPDTADPDPDPDAIGNPGAGLPTTAPAIPDPRTPTDTETPTDTAAVGHPGFEAAAAQPDHAAPTEPATPTKTVEPEVVDEEPATTSAGMKNEPAGAVTAATVEVAEPVPAKQPAATADVTRTTEPAAMTIAVAAEDIAPKAAATTGSPNLINIIGTIVFAVFDFISSILEGPPAVPARLEDQVTVGRSQLDIDCGSGHSVYADWYFPTSETPPTGVVYFQHGWPGRAGFYNETAAELAVRTNSIVLAPSITGNFMACDACNLTSDQMHYAVAKLFSGDWSALTASAAAAAGHDIVLPRSYILAGHSGGGLLAAGVAGYAARIAELTGQPLQLAGVLLWDTGAANDTVKRGLAALPTDVPVLSLSAEPSSLNGFSELDAVLDAARPSQFIGLRLVAATHGDFSQSTNPLVQAGMNLFGGQPTAVNTQAVLAISQGWIADMFAGTVFDPAARTGVYGDRGTSVTITTPAGTATADVLPGSPHQWTLGDYISVLLQNSLGLLASSPCAADVDALLKAEFGGAADPVGACQV